MGRKIFNYDDTFFLSVNEDEGTGLVKTRKDKINAIIKELKVNHIDSPDTIARKHGINPNSITKEETAYINRKVRGR